MAAVELGRAIYSAMRTLLSASTALQTLLSLNAAGIANRIYYVGPGEDPGEMAAPQGFWIEHYADLDFSEWPIVSGRYVQLIGDSGDNAERLTDAVRIVRGLLVERRLTAPAAEFTACRVWPMASGPVPTGDPQRWEHSIIWTVRCFAKDEVATLLAR